MTNLMVISNVKGYTENGTVYLNLEDVALGLGFSQIKSGIPYVRWGTVAEYMHSFGFSQQVGKETFIPENIFYRLAMKAKNDTAELFQIKVADEILPSIRKHGMYATEELLNNPDLAIKAFTALKEEREKNKLLQAAKENLTTENNLLARQNLTWTSRKVLEAIVKAYGASIKRPDINGFQEAWKEFKKELLYAHGINLNSRLTERINSTGKKNHKTLDMVHEEELARCISTAVALCRSANVDITDIIEKYQK